MKRRTNEISEAVAASWQAFCDAYAIEAEAATEEEKDYFLDVWRGSAEEAAALSYEEYRLINYLSE